MDHFVRPREYRRRDGEAERLGGLRVDDQLELRGFLHRQVGWVRPLENFVHVGGEASVHVGDARAVTQETPASANSRHSKMAGKRLFTARLTIRSRCSKNSGSLTTMSAPSRSGVVAQKAVSISPGPRASRTRRVSRNVRAA